VGVEDGFSFEKLDAIDLTGQNALVTGGNSGVGFATAKYLIKLGAEVTILCRSQTRCDDAAASIGGDNIKTLIADVSDLKKTRKATNEYAKTIKKLDMLFLNAGIAGSDEVLSVDGIEKIFATNYVGHHLMWQILKPAVLKSKQARVVLTSSGSNFQSYEYGVATDLETLNSAPKGMLTYGQSKLAQVLWAQELTRQLGATSNVYVNSFHPGVVATEIWGKNPSLRDSIFLPVVNFFKKNVMWTELQGAMTMLYLGAAADDLKEKNVRGKYFHPHAQEIVPNVLAQDLELQQKVWSFADALVKLG
jgi:NAD(P)-dependent dehydrogenase (short-subunit alcohol dehydrogenase family)